MKKLLFASGILLLGFHYRESIFGKKDTPTDEPKTPVYVDESLDNSPAVIQMENDVFSTYNNQVIKDADGYWMLVLNGKLYSPTSLETLQKWQKTNFKKPPVVEVNQHVWLDYQIDPSRYGGSF